MKLTPESYAVLQEARRRFILAGPGGMCKGKFRRGDQRCIMGHVCDIEDEQNLFYNVAYQAIRQASMKAGADLVTLNDVLGDEEVVAHLDRMLVECAPLSEAATAV